MKVKEFIDAYKAKNFMNNKQGIEERVKWIKKELEIKKYIPFRKKRKIAEMIVDQNIEIVDGIKKYNSIDGYVSLIVASIIAHTNLQFSEDVISDYDLLAESGLLTEILAEFDSSHKEIEILLNMALDMELEDNEINAIVARFLGNISEILDVVKDKIEGFDFKSIFGDDITEEDLAKLSGLLNKLK